MRETDNDQSRVLPIINENQENIEVKSDEKVNIIPISNEDNPTPPRRRKRDLSRQGGNCGSGHGDGQSPCG